MRKYHDGFHKCSECANYIPETRQCKGKRKIELISSKVISSYCRQFKEQLESRVS
jgi:hypothetical protein